MKFKNTENIQRILINNKNKKNYIENPILSIIYWLSSLCFWVFLILIIEIYKKDGTIKTDNFYEIYHFTPKKRTLKIVYLVLGIIFYIIYIIIELFSPILQYLKEYKNENIRSKIFSLFQSKPEISFQLKSSNNEIKDNFVFRSFRDISGLLYIKHNGIFKKNYIILEIKEQIIFADQETIDSYYQEIERKIDELKCNNNEKVELFEEKKIRDVQKYYVLREQAKDSLLINKFWFYFFLFLSLVELYKIYINCKFIKKSFTLRKVISKSNDLNEDNKFNIFYPKLALFNQTVEKYDNNNKNKNSEEEETNTSLKHKHNKHIN